MSFEVRDLDLAASGTAEAVVVLQRASYRVEADLLGARTLPALKESPRQLRRTRERFIGAFEGERLVGAVSWKRHGSLVDVHRLVVHPDRFRRGIAGLLLDALDAREGDAERSIVATGAANAPARRLYEHRGFTAVEEHLAPGSIVATGAANAPARRLYERRGFNAVEERLAPGSITIVTYEKRSAPR